MAGDNEFNRGPEMKALNDWNLSIDLHAEFMVSRAYEKDTVLNWYSCGYSGGG